MYFIEKSKILGQRRNCITVDLELGLHIMIEKLYKTYDEANKENEQFPETSHTYTGW